MFSMQLPPKQPTEMTGFSHKASTAVARQILFENQAETLLKGVPRHWLVKYIVPIIPRLHKNQTSYVQSRREEIGCQSEMLGTLTLADRKAQFSRSVHGARMMAAMPLCPRRSYQRAFASRSSSVRV